MAASEREQTDSRGLQTIAEELGRDCRRLKESLTVLMGASPGQIEDACRRHLEEVRHLRRRMSAAVGTLRRRWDEASDLSPSAREELRAQVSEWRRMLERASETYSRLTGDMSASLAEAGQELLDLQRAGRMLRTYAEGARLTA
ncbi:hypothetical protein ES703_118692 [subsurface metagenome]